jgi:hypothetical protein
MDGYRTAVPRSDESRSGRLRNGVVAAGKWRGRWLGGWRPAIGVGFALGAVFLLALFWAIVSSVSKNDVGSSVPGSAATGGAATILKNALKAAANPLPYSGTSEITFGLSPSDAPKTAAGDLSQNRIISQYALRDSTHWWIHTRILQPALQREDQYAVSDGKTAVWYRSLTNTALSFPLQSGTGSGLFAELQGSHSIAQNLKQFVGTLSSIPGEKVNLIRQDRLRLPGDATSGHLTDVVQVSPVIRESGSCGTAQCASKSRGYGRALLWIERSDGMVLRYEEMGMPTSGEFPQHFAYRVTSLKLSGPTAAQLAYHPPVTPIQSSSSSSGSSGGGVVGGSLGSQWTAPTGLVSLPAPTDAHGYAYTSCGSGQGTDSLGNTISASVLFVNGWKSGPLKGRICTHPFVYVQEQVRAQGLPGAMKVGAPHLSGACTAYACTGSRSKEAG